MKKFIPIFLVIPFAAYAQDMSRTVPMTNWHPFSNGKPIMKQFASACVYDPVLKNLHSKLTGVNGYNPKATVETMSSDKNGATCKVTLHTKTGDKYLTFNTRYDDPTISFDKESLKTYQSFKSQSNIGKVVKF
jgi:hypothetical protein